MNAQSADLKGTAMICVPDISQPLKDRVDQKTLDAYAKSVEDDAKAVCDGIVAAMLQQKLKASASQNEGMWMVTVADKPAPAANDDHSLQMATLTTDPPPQRQIFNIRINSRDVPPTINALANFFARPRTVAGLVLTVAAVGATAAGYQLAVRRAPNPPSDAA